MYKEVPKLESHSPQIIQKVRKKKQGKEPHKIRFSQNIFTFRTLLRNKVE